MSSKGKRGGRSLVALSLAIAFSLLLVAVTVVLPPPGTEASPLNYEVVTFGSWNDVSPAWSPDGKTIAYVSDRNGVRQIFAMRPDGSSDRAVTPTGYNSTDPAWSPDSASIAFWSQTGSRTSIRIIHVSKSSIETVTDGKTTVMQGQPRWSPDGKRLLFFTVSNATTLVSYDLGTKVATTVASVEGGNVSACWVSSTEVAYSSLQGGMSELLWADVGNGTHGVLLSGNASFSNPIASVVSAKLAYMSDVVPPNQYGREYIGTYEPGDYNIWVENLDGSNNSYQYGMVPMAGSVHTWTQPYEEYPCPYTPGTISLAQDLSWSPDGSVTAYIAYDSELVPQLYLWDVIQWASTIGPISQAVNSSIDPAWGPDSVSLAFASVQGGYYHIFVMNTTNVVGPMPAGLRAGSS